MLSFFVYPFTSWYIFFKITVTGVTGTSLATLIYLAKTVNVPADDVLSVLDKPIYLMENDILKGGASAASDLDLFISYEVINDA